MHANDRKWGLIDLANRGLTRWSGTSRMAIGSLWFGDYAVDIVQLGG
jgi:hypothetical protein